MSEDLQYPIGRFRYDGPASAQVRHERIQHIAALPHALAAAIDPLSASQLDTEYRPGGWTVRQVVHHLADSHLNAYARFRLALTESEPTIKTYDQERWAELADARTAEPQASLWLLEGLHKRWTLLLESLAAPDFERRLVHPEHGTITLDYLLALYAWHGRHHVAHVTALRERNGWG
jgi:uncharacterized damage-inducible protein DinB